MASAPLTLTPPTAATTLGCDATQQRERRELRQQQVVATTLLAELRRATNYWLQTKSDDGFQMLVQTCSQILQHDLVLQPQPGGGGELQRLADDFEFLLASEEKMKRQQQQPQPPYRRCSEQQQTQQAPRSVDEFFRRWITRCLQARCLSQCLQSLVADKELMECYYQRESAFLRHSGHATTLFVCLMAVQLNQSSLLSQLEVHRQLRHRRTCSQPNFNISPRLQVVPEEKQNLQQQQRQSPTHVRHHQRLRRFKSLPNLYHDPDEEQEAARRRCQTYSSPRTNRTTTACGQGDEPDMLPSTSAGSYHSSSSRSSTSMSSISPRRIQLINCDDIKIWTDQTDSQPAEIPQSQSKYHCQSQSQSQCSIRASPLNNFLTNLFGSPPVYTSWFNHGLGEDLNGLGGDSVLDNFLPVNGRKLKKKQTLFEGVSMLDEAAAAAAASPSTFCTAPLDIVGMADGSYGGSLATSSSSASATPGSLSSDKMDQQSLATFLQMSRYTHNNTDLEKENAHFRISEACITAIEHVKWSRRDVAKPSAAPYSTDPDLMPYVEQMGSLDGGHSSHSAEAVGLQLISRFNDQQLPRVGHLKWLVSEQDTPQQLLPMPKQEQDKENAGASLTRGTKTWAPPRQQIIFTEHPSVSRGQQLSRQGNRCAGCGMRVARQYQHHFRYCSYLGKYMCTGCHRNQISAIPAKILQNWDFRCYPVSSFAYRLIEQMYTFPLFHVPDLNAQLYVKHKDLATARRRRLQLQSVRKFIGNCRFAAREQAFFNAIPVHLTQDPNMWSMCDFVDVQNSSMSRSIKELILLSEQHVHNCVLCVGRAFVCEYCKSSELLYPWQRKIERCAGCGACSHHSCWKARRSEPCLRCTRLQARAS
ncbi:run domain Beclin-1-interacting and cysteine-rich domain-containing protein [Drosophila obscura]|uniref:run domain Beclin-1-interacting and cysteine-rich domain-containing protein n=1 Tax=Drosophila obscura TaxID=7282 RepID=UPI001BB27B62|nr:run domain Beclin-1-interacting and cysteine-rich domain-containing protein [Drosophila obscura]